jgi:hypothetical protein
MPTFILDRGVMGTAVVTAPTIEEAKAILLKKYPYIFDGAEWLDNEWLKEQKDGESFFIDGRAKLFLFYDISQEQEFGPYHDREPFVPGLNG